MSEACRVVAFHEALQRATKAQILWIPSTNESTKYRSNVEFGPNTDKTVMFVTELYGDQELIQLTINNGILYFT